MDDADIEYLSRYVTTSQQISEIEVWYINQRSEMFRAVSVGKRPDERGPCLNLKDGTYVALNTAETSDFHIVVRIDNWPSQRGA